MELWTRIFGQTDDDWVDEPISRNAAPVSGGGYRSRGGGGGFNFNLGGGGGGGGNVCYNCQQTGHVSQNCPNERMERPRRPTVIGAEGGGNEMPREEYCPTIRGLNLIEERKENWKGTGINFSKYKEIAVKVTGKNAPPHVEKFENMGLRSLVLSNIKNIGYTEPTPIQKYAIPIILDGRDLMACAQTGSGKTGAYLLPIITHLLVNQNVLPEVSMSPAQPFVLILAPTRELAIQIHKEASIYANGSIIKVKVVYGGTPTGSAKLSIQNGPCHILVATPGRLKQFINENIISLKKLMFFVLDEADRMLDMGFKEDIEDIFKTVPKGEVKSSLFSATLPEEIQAMASSFLKNYLFVRVGTVGGACSDVKQNFLQVPRSEKRDALFSLLKEMDSMDKILIFVNTKIGADFLAAALSRANISATSIHGDRFQFQREIAIGEFTSGRHRILVGTAVAARGLDIPQVSVVINYELPREIDEYVHRIGRTGRIGHIGLAISLFDHENPYDVQLASKLIRILKDAEQHVPEFLEDYAVGDGIFGFASRDFRKGPGNAFAGGDDEWD